jgi:singapore isolate B (sub-type 7) whole genome shotgun sequence assembly, scaffold_19
MRSYLIYGEKSTWPTVLSCITVVVGYIAGVDGEVNFSLRGTLFGVGASLIGTFYTISLHHYLANIKMNSWELSFYNNFNSSIIIIVMVLLNGEIPVIWNHRNELSLSFFLWTALGMFGGEVSWVAGIVGLFVGITTQLQIKYTSSLSHNISGVAKNCIQTFMGAAIYRTPLTFTGVCGVLLVVGGSFTYTLERIRINSQKEKNPDQESIQLISKEKNQLAEVAVVDES